MRARILLLVALCCLTFFAGLGRPAMTDSDEAFYAEAGREMVERGDYLTPYFGYEPRFQKPILFYWLVAAAYHVAGISEAAARVGAAAAGLGLVLVIVAAARRWFDERTAFLAGLVAATSFGYFWYARQSLPDLPLAFFVTVCTWSALVAVGDAPSHPRAWLLLSAGAAGLGFLTKGPVGVVLPVVVVACVAIIERIRTGRSTTVGAGDVALAALVFVLVAAPWYVEMWRVHGSAYLRAFFVGDNLERFATARFNDPRGIWYYVPVLLAGLLPWSPFLLLTLRPAAAVLLGRRSVTPVEIRLLVWAAVPFLVLTASVGKQPRYLLPVMPPLAILLARTIAGRLAAGARRANATWWGIGTTGGLAGAVIIVLGWGLYLLRPLVLGLPDGALVMVCRLIWIAGATVIAVSWSRLWRMVPFVVAGAAVVAALGAHYAVLSRPGAEPVEQVASIIRGNLRPGDRWSAYDVFLRNLPFYVKVPESHAFDAAGLLALVQSSTHVVVAIRQEDLTRFEARFGLRLRRLGEIPYVNTSKLKLARVLRPDPVRDIQTVLVVSNR